MDLVQKALAQLNEIKKVAEAQAKQSINEEVDSFISQRWTAKLNEMADEEDDVDLEEEFNFGLDEVEDEEEDTEEDPAGDSGLDDMGGMDDDAAIPTTEPSADLGQGGGTDGGAGYMPSPEELVSMIKDAVAQALSGDANSDGQADVSNGTDMDTGNAGIVADTEEDDVDDLEELDFDGLLAEAESQLPKSDPNQKKINESKEVSALKGKLKDAQKANKLLKESFSKLLTSNARLLHMNSIFANYTLSDKQKVVIAEKFDGAKTMSEAKLLAESMSAFLDTKGKSKVKTVIKESRGNSQKPMGSTKPSNNTVDPNAELIHRMQVRAGIIKE